MEKEQRRSSQAGPRRPHLILVIDSDSAKEDTWEEQPNGQADIVHGKPYTCPTLTPSKGKKEAKLEKEVYLFNISKAD